jgi:hypothetical protein
MTDLRDVLKQVDAVAARFDSMAARRRDSDKLHKDEVHYRQATGEDTCGKCRSFREPYGCLKVAGSIDPDFTCDVGHSKADGHAYAKVRST